QLNEKQMMQMGMKISAADIYSINKGSLKDAIVSFGGFCTGEVISDKSLILTNHHCGFDAIQDHSTVERNYLRDGFWARNHGEEIPNQGLFVTFIVSIHDVTSQVLKTVATGISEMERQSAVDKNIAVLRQNFKREAHQDILVRPFFEGNQYFLFVTETFRDVRLVGAPPSSIGNFGKDTDNWMWPRHTGDFSLFRIYAGKDNKPAAYSTENVPYKPKKSLSVSLDGVAENDFTMVFGFPGRTMQYLPAVAVEQIIRLNDPVKIGIREKALNVIDGYMRADEATRIQYASKYASIQNAYKKWQGEILGMERTKGLEKKRARDSVFQARVNANPAWKMKWGQVLPELEALYRKFAPYSLSRDYQSEVIGRVELFSIANQLNTLIAARENNGEAGFQKALPVVKERLNMIYKDYHPEVDKQVFAALMETYVNSQEKSMLAPELMAWVDIAGMDYQKLADRIYNSTDLDNGQLILSQLEKDPGALLENHRSDKANELFLKINSAYSKEVASKLNGMQSTINTMLRTYMQAQMEVFKEKTFYPDANSTLRVTYGKVKGYEPRNAVQYAHTTYLEGVMEKYVPGDYEFDLPPKLVELYNSKDYGKYGDSGKMPVCFIGTNHTTGGNSGSPALDAHGNLVGLNFDRVWEGTMSDLNYDPSICRNIMVDIRYILFIVDKFAGASNLIAEMKLVHPKSKR
ncbi:MAG: S46 family peptidase, partial [Flavisolibacter sp.]|nr:S46 family peptidase [Flavisolibacter sp.]